MDINFELYKVFYYVASEESFSKAAAKLFISQSAVSQSIKTLEDKLETTLFIRHPKNIRLTNEGQTLYNHAEPAFHLLESGENKLREIHHLERGVINIAVNDTICKYYLLNHLKAFNENYPGIKVHITNRTSYRCVKLLEEGTADFIFTYLPNDHLHAGMKIIDLMDFRDVFICGSKYTQLIKDMKTCTDLESMPWIMLKKDTTTRKFFDQHFEKEGMDPSVEIELTSIDLIKDLVRIGLGISCVPDFCLKDMDQDLHLIPVESCLPSRKLSMVINPKMPLSLASEAFIELMRK